MSSRVYDYILTVSDTSPFKQGNTILGLTSNAFGYIANVDSSTSNIKVKMSNVDQEFSVSESVVSNHYLISNTFHSSTHTVNQTPGEGQSLFISVSSPVDTNIVSELDVFVGSNLAQRSGWTYHTGNNQLEFFAFATPNAGSVVTIRRQTGNTQAYSFQSSHQHLGNVQSSTTATISAIYNSPFIATLNAFTQAPIVRLVEVYYPGEWYPPNEAGNPSGTGAGYAWPTETPLRFAEVIGDIYSDLSYNVTFKGESYTPYPMEADGIATSSDGTIDRVTFTMSNYDNLITTFVENPYIVGNVTSNSAQGYVNGELVYGLDPRTVTGNTHYDQDTVDNIYGGANSPWLYDQAISLGETWKNLKSDSRDLLGAVVEFKTTFANHLKYWPEHSKIDYMSANVVSVLNGSPYRPGDNVTTTLSTNTVQIQDIQEERILFLSAPLTSGQRNENLYIVNDDYDEEAYVRDVFKVTKLNLLNETVAEFELTSWLQYFKLQLPKRKFFKNTCQWVYKGSECQYPGPGSLPIPGTFPPKTSNANPIFANNQAAVSDSDDECSKSYEACRIRNNTVHFGAFPGTGRQIPKQ